MNPHRLNPDARIKPQGGFTLMETVIAIGVLAVLLTAFMAVFGPAASGIRRAINTQEADRLASTLVRELVTLRPGQESDGVTTGFDKAFNWIAESDQAASALLVYQYRGDPSSQRSDGTLQPYRNANGEPGKDFIVQPMVRRLDDTLFMQDIEALEGSVFCVKAIQLVYNNGELKLGTAGEIQDPKNGTPAASSEAYPEATIAFAAEFYGLPGNNAAYFSGNGFASRYSKLRNPIFSRNLGVRR